MYDSAGTATPVKCSAGNIKLCAENGTVGCTLHYRDANVTSKLTPGKTARLCNTAWKEFVAFDKVAYVKGSAMAPYTGPGGINSTKIPETEAYALVQVLKAVDRSVTVNWAISQDLFTGYKTARVLTTPGLYDVMVHWSRASVLIPPSEVPVLQGNVGALKLSVTNGPLGQADPLQRHPALDEHLVAALLQLPWLSTLELTVGRGSIPPQLRALSAMYVFSIKHYCLRGQLPTDLFKSWHAASVIQIAGERGFSDASGNEPCGLSGTLPSHRQGTNPGLVLNLGSNRLSGELPGDLLAWGYSIDLSNNQFSGIIRAPGDVINTHHLDLSDNLLEVRAVDAAAVCVRVSLRHCLYLVAYLSKNLVFLVVVRVLTDKGGVDAAAGCIRVSPRPLYRCSCSMLCTDMIYICMVANMPVGVTIH
jgi:hypothetical protein